MRNLPRAQPLIKRLEIGLLRHVQRPAIGQIGEIEHCLELPRFGVEQLLLIRSGPFLDRQSHRFEHRGIAVFLGGKLPELLEAIDQREGVAAHKMQLIPQPVELRLLRVIQHQARELIILPIVQQKGDHFIHRNNFCVAKRRRKDRAEIIHRRTRAGLERSCLRPR